MNQRRHLSSTVSSSAGVSFELWFVLRFSWLPRFRTVRRRIPPCSFLVRSRVSSIRRPPSVERPRHLLFRFPVSTRPFRKVADSERRWENDWMLSLHDDHDAFLIVFAF